MLYHWLAYRGILVNHSGLTVPPTGLTVPPTGLTAPPTGLTVLPTGLTAPPTGLTAPPTGLAAPPTVLTAPPTGLTAPPTGSYCPSHWPLVLPDVAEGLPNLWSCMKCGMTAREITPVVSVQLLVCFPRWFSIRRTPLSWRNVFSPSWGCSTRSSISSPSFPSSLPPCPPLRMWVVYWKIHLVTLCTILGTSTYSKECNRGINWRNWSHTEARIAMIKKCSVSIGMLKFLPECVKIWTSIKNSVQCYQMGSILLCCVCTGAFYIA